MSKLKAVLKFLGVGKKKTPRKTRSHSAEVAYEKRQKARRNKIQNKVAGASLKKQERLMRRDADAKRKSLASLRRREETDIVFSDRVTKSTRLKNKKINALADRVAAELHSIPDRLRGHKITKPRKPPRSPATAKKYIERQNRRVKRSAKLHAKEFASWNKRGLGSMSPAQYAASKSSKLLNDVRMKIFAAEKRNRYKRRSIAPYRDGKYLR